MYVCMLSGCAHNVIIDSKPSGAKVTINGQAQQGVTPLTFTEETGFNKTYSLKIEKEGYKPLTSTITQEEWNKDIVIKSVCGAACCGLPGLGILWSRQLRGTYYFELEKEEVPVK